MDRFIVKVNQKDLSNDPIIINPLQENINILKTNVNQTINWYHISMKMAADQHEFAAMVYLYDCLKKINEKPPDSIYKIIERLHSKTLPENNNIIVPFSSDRKLKPRRRIHKIIKGLYYSDNYQNTEKYMNKAIHFINQNVNYPKNKIELIKAIKAECNCTDKESRYIITRLKRKKLIN